MVSNYIKKRLLAVLELLYKETDEENPISTSEIMEYLNGKDLPIDTKRGSRSKDTLLKGFASRF